MNTNTQLALLTLAIIMPSMAFSQTDSDSEKPLLQSVERIEKKTDKLNIFLNMQGDYSMQADDGSLEDGKFQMRQLRIELVGNINDWLSYRFRQALNKGEGTTPYTDNVLGSVDNAWIGVKMDKWKLMLGKQCSAVGGFEFDQNPIEIYEASDINGMGISYLTGVDLAYHFNAEQELHLQVGNSSPLSAKQQYGDYVASKMPLVYTLNWNGRVCDFYRVRWSASLMQQVKGKQLYYYALGNEVSLGRFYAYFDWMYAREGVDLRGIVTDIVCGSSPLRHVENTRYMSYVLNLNYEFAPRWHAFAKLMLEDEGVYAKSTADSDGNAVSVSRGKYRTAYGYIGGLEYYPMDHSNLHFFVAYVGRAYQYTSRAKAFGAEDYNTNRFSVGFVWKMPVF